MIDEKAFPGIPYKIGDKYIITIPKLFDGGLPTGGKLKVCFSRDPRNNINLPITRGQTNLLRQCDGIEVPAININGQTLIDGSDVGNMIFTVDDKYSYKKEKHLPLDTKICTLDCISVDQLKTTVFNKCCPKMVSVVRGDDDNNLQQKVYILWEEINNSQPFFDTIFYPTFIQYGMVKLILSRLLYGCFDINFLLWKYDKKFLKDLSNSRFCNFGQYFNDPLFSNFDQYFKYN